MYVAIDKTYNNGMNSPLIPFILGVLCAIIGLGRLLAVRPVALKLTKALAAWHGYPLNGSLPKAGKIAAGARRNVPASLPEGPEILDVANALAAMGAPKSSAMMWARDAAAALPGASFDATFRKAMAIRGAALAGIVSRSQVPA